MLVLVNGRGQSSCQTAVFRIDRRVNDFLLALTSCCSLSERERSVKAVKPPDLVFSDVSRPSFFFLDILLLSERERSVSQGFKLRSPSQHTWHFVFVLYTNNPSSENHDVMEYLVPPPAQEATNEENFKKASSACRPPKNTDT